MRSILRIDKKKTHQLGNYVAYIFTILQQKWWQTMTYISKLFNKKAISVKLLCKIGQRRQSCASNRRSSGAGGSPILHCEALVGQGVATKIILEKNRPETQKQETYGRTRCLSRKLSAYHSNVFECRIKVFKWDISVVNYMGGLRVGH